MFSIQLLSSNDIELRTWTWMSSCIIAVLCTIITFILPKFNHIVIQRREEVTDMLVSTATVNPQIISPKASSKYTPEFIPSPTPPKPTRQVQPTVLPPINNHRKSSYIKNTQTSILQLNTPNN